MKYKKNKEYTKLRQFYSWIGFMVIVVLLAIFMTLFVQCLIHILTPFAL